jgi:hypothetical protein
MNNQIWKNVKANPFHPSRTAPAKTFRSVVMVNLSAILLLVLLQNSSAVAQGSPQTNGYITVVLRGECADAPPSAPPVGAIRVGPNYVMMTVGVGDPADWQHAQQLATDGVFESLMPLYCSLSANPSAVCFENRVQWSVELYDAAGNPHVSGCAASGCEYHYFDSPCSVSPSEQIQFLITWVNVDIIAGILDIGDGNHLTAKLKAALGSALNGHTEATARELEKFVREVKAVVRTGRLPETAAETLIDGAKATITQSGSKHN